MLIDALLKLLSSECHSTNISYIYTKPLFLCLLPFTSWLWFGAMKNDKQKVCLYFSWTILPILSLFSYTIDDGNRITILGTLRASIVTGLINSPFLMIPNWFSFLMKQTGTMGWSWCLKFLSPASCLVKSLYLNGVTLILSSTLIG